MPSTYALYALETILDEPQNVTREREGAAALVRATWSCGCTAAGRTSNALVVVPCPAHTEVFAP